jgi:hypothetical protein
VQIIEIFTGNRPEVIEVLRQSGPPGPQGAPGASSGLSPVVANSSTQAVSNAIYLIDALSLVSITLPTSPVIGDSVAINGSLGAAWRILQNAGQQVRVGDRLTTAGVAGGVESRALGDALWLIYAGAGLWTAVSVFGNFEVT